jgi:Uma2 family endonuclease
MSTMIAEPEYRVLHGQTWQDYERALAERDRQGRRHRITYDRGALEVMSNSAAHERWKKLLASLLETYCVTAGIPFAGLGQWTFRREDLNRGLDPDECYYVGHEPLVRGRTDLDLRADPPPDLAIEVEVTRTVVDRLGIYAALGVPEVWRYDGAALTVLLLGPEGEYAPAAASRAFPVLPLDELNRRLTNWGATDQATWLRDWQAWVLANAAAR